MEKAPLIITLGYMVPLLKWHLESGIRCSDAPFLIDQAEQVLTKEDTMATKV